MTSRYVRASSTPVEVGKSRFIQPVLRSSLLYQPAIAKVKPNWAGRSMPVIAAGSTPTEDGALSELDVEVALQGPQQASAPAPASKAKGTKRARPSTTSATAAAAAAAATKAQKAAAERYDDDDDVIEIVQSAASKRAKSVPRSSASTTTKEISKGMVQNSVSPPPPPPPPVESHPTIVQHSNLTSARPSTPGPFADVASLLTTPSFMAQRKALLVLVHDASKKTFHRLLDEQSNRTTFLQTIARKVDAEVKEISYLVGDHRIAVEDDDDFSAMREYVLLNHFRAPVVVSISTDPPAAAAAAPSKKTAAVRKTGTAAKKSSASTSAEQKEDEMDVDGFILPIEEVQNPAVLQETATASKEAIADTSESSAPDKDADEIVEGQQSAASKPVSARAKKAAEKKAEKEAAAAAAVAVEQEEGGDADVAAEKQADVSAPAVVSEVAVTQKKASARKAASKKANADEARKDAATSASQTQGQKTGSKAVVVAPTSSTEDFCKLCWTAAHHPDHCPVISAGIDAVMKRFEELREMGYDRSDGESDAFSFLFKYIESFKLPDAPAESPTEAAKPVELAGSPSKKSKTDAKPAQPHSPSKKAKSDVKVPEEDTSSKKSKAEAKATSLTKPARKLSNGVRKKSASPVVQADDELVDEVENDGDEKSSVIVESDSNDGERRKGSSSSSGGSSSSSSSDDSSSDETSSDESDSESSSEEESGQSSKGSVHDARRGQTSDGRANDSLKTKTSSTAVARVKGDESEKGVAEGTTKKSSQKSSSYGFTPLSKLNPRNIQIKATSNGKSNSSTTATPSKASSNVKAKKPTSDSDTEPDSDSSSSSSDSSSDEHSRSAKKPTATPTKSKSAVPASKRAGASTAGAQRVAGRPRKSLLSQMGLVED